MNQETHRFVLLHRTFIGSVERGASRVGAGAGSQHSVPSRLQFNIWILISQAIVGRGHVGANTPEASERLKMLQLRLITQKRETLHTGNKNVIKEIRITKVEEQEDE